MEEAEQTGKAPGAADASGTRKKKLIRLGLAVVLFAVLSVVGKWTGLLDSIDREVIRDTVNDAGPWGVLLYVAIFALGELVHIPGFVFVGAAALVYGYWLGYGAALAGSLLSVSVSFVVVRTVGGNALSEIRWRWVRKVLGQLDDHPIRTVVILRSVFWLAPPLNYAVAMTNIRFRDYLIGSTIGLILPVLGMITVFHYLLN